MSVNRELIRNSDYVIKIIFIILNNKFPYITVMKTKGELFEQIK